MSSAPQTAQPYSDLAKNLLTELQQQARNVVDTHPEVGPLETLPAADPTYSCATKVVFTGLLVWERVQICCSSTPPIMATTDIWGPTVAVGGVSFGTMWSSIPFSDLPGLGDLGIQVNIASAVVQISWWRNGTPIASFLGGGIGIGAAVLGGNCKFQNGTC